MSTEFFWQLMSWLMLVTSLFILFHMNTTQEDIKKLKKLFADLVSRVLFSDFASRFRRRRKKFGDCLDYEDESEYVGRKPKTAPRRARRKKYADMDGRERIRYVYEINVKRAVRQGAKIDPSMTAAESLATMKKSGFTAYYNEARYDEYAVIDLATAAEAAEKIR